MEYPALLEVISRVRSRSIVTQQAFAFGVPFDPPPQHLCLVARVHPHGAGGAQREPRHPRPGLAVPEGVGSGSCAEDERVQTILANDRTVWVTPITVGQSDGNPLVAVKA